MSDEKTLEREDPESGGQNENRPTASSLSSSSSSSETSPSSPQTPESKPEEIPYDDPFKFSARKKWTITVLLAAVTFTSTFCSSIFSSTIVVTAQRFDVSEEVTLLGVSLFVLGYAVGPLFWGPLSELLGRKIPIFTAFFIFGLIQIPIALSPTLVGVLICRWLAGCFGAAPVALASAVFADFWAPTERGLATSLYSAAVYGGPTLGPVIGAFVTESHLGWRWTAWLVLILVGAIGIPAFIVVPETYAPVLKERAARKLGRDVQENKRITFNGFVRKYLTRPISMLLQEPVLLIITIYVSAVYAIMYLTFFAFPYAFTLRGWPRRTASLPFLSLLIGVLSGCIIVSVYSTKYYQPRLKARKGVIVPEDRLPLVMLGGVLLPIGLFWFAWTSSPDIIWVPQVISAYFIGAGIMLVFTNCLVYIVDIYLSASASALAGNALLRSIAAAGLPLAGPVMYRNLGVPWATSTLAFICVALAPAPFVFYRYGAWIRSKSTFAMNKK